MLTKKLYVKIDPGCQEWVYANYLQCLSNQKWRGLIVENDFRFKHISLKSPHGAGFLSRICVCLVDARLAGGEGGIRTHGTLARTAVFETARFNHSRTSPYILKELSRLLCRSGLDKLAVKSSFSWSMRSNITKSSFFTSKIVIRR